MEKSTIIKTYFIRAVINPLYFLCLLIVFLDLCLNVLLKMAVKIILMLSFHLCLAHLELDIRAQAKNPCTQQCTQTKKDNFQKKHLLQKTPKTMDLEVWSRFLEENQLCSNKNRSVQSFLDSNQKSKVDEVCTPAGGKVFKPDSNLCISKKTFTFFEVYVNIDECKVFKVSYVSQHIILGCDKFRKKCLPVHFEFNRQNDKPQNGGKNCKSAQYEDLLY